METIKDSLKIIFIFLVKYIPIMQMIGILLNSTLYYCKIIFKASYILDYLLGNSIITTILLYVCSYMFRFCYWHRFIITSNVVVISIMIFKTLLGISADKLTMLILYYIIYLMFVILILIKKFKMK